MSRLYCIPSNLILLTASYARAMAMRYDDAVAITVNTRPPDVTRSVPFCFTPA